MKRILLATVALVALSTTATAQNQEAVFDCRYGVAKFSSRQEAREEKRDPDPIVKIIVSTWIAKDNKPTMIIVHVARSGREFDRAEQYPTNTVKHGPNSFVWHGVYDRDPNVVMVGSLRQDRSGVTYTETRFKGGVAEWSNRTYCRRID